MKTDFLKAALEKKKALQKQSGKKNTSDSEQTVHSSQVSTNKPAKKSAGRGR